jgi:hypothetical protein
MDNYMGCGCLIDFILILVIVLLIKIILKL